MKLRIQSQSIRVRLSITDVKTLCKQGSITDQCIIGSQIFQYILKLNGIEKIKADFNDNQLIISLNPTLIDGWEFNQIVGFDNVMENPDGSSLKILIEKDFVCLDNTTEDQSDNYPNPKSAC